MTQLNTPQPREKYEEKAGHLEQSGSDHQVMRNARWGAILLAMAGLTFFGFAVSSVSFTDWEDYILIGFPLLLTSVSLASIYIMQRGRVVFGSGIVFALNLMLPILLTIIVTDTFWAAFYYAIISSTLLIWRALPRKSWLWSIIVTGAALVVIVTTNVIDSPNRFSSPPGFDVFVVAVIVGITLAFVVQATRQAWLRNDIRSRFLTFSLGLTLIAVAVIAGISVGSLLSAGQQAQETSSQVLRSQVQDSLVRQTVELANQNDIVLQGTGQDAANVAKQAAYILENPYAFNTETLWKADDHMYFGPEGQYINGTQDVSTVFVPKTVVVNDDFKQRLELLAYLDMALVPVYEGDPNSVAIYFVGKDEISWLYPNINLGTIVSADYLATQDIFYSIGAPENNPERQVVWTPVYDDPGGQGLLVSVIAPIYTSTNNFMGVIGIDVSLVGLTKAIEQENLTTGGYTFLLDTDGRALALPEQGYRDFLGRERGPGEFGSDFASSARTEFAPLLADILAGETGFQNIIIDDQELFVAYTTLENTGWHIASVVSADQVLAPATTLQTELGELSSSLVFQRIIPIGVILITIVVIAGIFFTNRLVNPIEQLTEVAGKIGAGEWETPLPHSELNEISGLSQTLSAMAAQLKSTLGSLEQRVANRTRNLVLAAEVGHAVSQVRELDVMLRDACELILEEFDLYYVQVYLTDPGQMNLVLEAGTGEVGTQLLERSHSLPLNTGSINGRAAVEKRSLVISDTAESATFHPNVLLPETRGEMAVPLIVADKVVGVLDMQSSAPGALNEEVLPAFEALAGQLAVAVQNANLLKEAEQARAEVEAQARRLVRTSWNEYLDAVHKPEQVSYVFDHNEVTPLEDVGEAPLPEHAREVSVPISVTGEMVGSLVVELEGNDPDEQTSELIEIVARQVAQQLENLRLLESAERYRFEAEQAARRQIRTGWQEYTNAKTDGSLGYIYDLKEVRPYKHDHEDISALTLPLRVRDEAIGKLSVQGVTSDDDEAVELVNTVAERLGTHIESLRLHDQTQFALAQSEKLFDASRSLTQSANLQELVAATVKTMDIPVVNRALLTKFEYDSEGEIEQLSIVANWWNGEGHEVTPVGTRYSQETIQLMPMFVSPTPVFFADTLNDERVDDTTMELVKRLNLRAVAVLPLHLGSTQIGALILEAEDTHQFTPGETRLFTSLAPQIATVLENRQQYEQAQRQAERESMLNTINQKIQSATSVEAVLQIAARELGHALGSPMTVAQLSMKNQN